MKRNIGFAIMAIAQILSLLGVDVQINDADMENLVTVIGGIVVGIGSIHDVIRRSVKKKAKGE